MRAITVSSIVFQKVQRTRSAVALMVGLMSHRKEEINSLIWGGGQKTNHVPVKPNFSLKSFKFDSEFCEPYHEGINSHFESILLRKL